MFLGNHGFNLSNFTHHNSRQSICVDLVLFDIGPRVYELLFSLYFYKDKNKIYLILSYLHRSFFRRTGPAGVPPGQLGRRLRGRPQLHQIR